MRKHCTFYYDSKSEEDSQAKDLIETLRSRIEERFGPITCWDGDELGWGTFLEWQGWPELVIYPQVFVFHGLARIKSFLQEALGSI